MRRPDKEVSDDIGFGSRWGRLSPAPDAGARNPYHPGADPIGAGTARVLSLRRGEAFRFPAKGTVDRTAISQLSAARNLLLSVGRWSKPSRSGFDELRGRLNQSRLGFSSGIHSLTASHDGSIGLKKPNTRRISRTRRAVGLIYFGFRRRVADGESAVLDESLRVSGSQ